MNYNRRVMNVTKFNCKKENYNDTQSTGKACCKYMI